jgi:hypothetical protein
MLWSLTIALPAHATSVLLVHAARSQNDDVAAGLVATGAFTAVDSFDAELMTPWVEDLLPYDAVLVYSDHSFDDSVTLGNVLADYADAGGGVVLAVFSHGSVALEGRFVDEGYEPFTGSSQGQGDLLTLVPTLPDHALLADVTAFDGGTGSFHTDDPVVADGAVTVATWSNGLPLVVTKGTSVGLNFFPPSSDARADLWTATTDGDLLLRNALQFAADAALSDSDGDGVPDDLDACEGADDTADADADATPDACDPCPFDEADACAPADTGDCGEDEDEDEDEEEEDEDEDYDLRWCCDTGRGGALGSLLVGPLALLISRRRRT